MKVKVYQVIKKSFNKQGLLLPKEERTFKVMCIGTVIVPKNKKEFIEEVIWDLFNWICWWYDKHLNTYLRAIRKGFRKRGYRCFPNSNARGYCNSDIFFKLEDKWIIAMPVGWDTADTFDEAAQKIINNGKYY